MTMNIDMARGDIKKFNFGLFEGKVPVTSGLSNIYFTVKRSSTSSRVLFQKRLTDGTIVLGEDNRYHVKIEPEDTNDLDYGTYVYDIQVVGHDLKKTFVGNFILTDEVTFASDEGE